MDFSANFYEEVVRTASFSQWQDHCEALLNEMPIRFPKDQPSLGERAGQASMGQKKHNWYSWMVIPQNIVEGSLEVKLPTIWRNEKQSRAEAERRGRLAERRSEEKE